MKKIINNFTLNPKNDILSGLTVALVLDTGGGRFLLRGGHRSARRFVRRLYDGVDHCADRRPAR